MNRLNKLRAFLKPAKSEPTEEGKKWMLGYEAYKKGKDHYLANELLEALANFDRAIDYGFGQGRHENGEVFGLRGSCLQSLGWDLDAIDDLDKAILLRQEYAQVCVEGEDCNLYYMRSQSKRWTGDHR
jgi:hypothetical protein